MIFIKKYIVFILLYFSVLVFSQTYAKINTLALPLSIINAGIEAKTSKKTTIETEIFISPWKSFFGKKLQIYSLNVEERYYFNESFKKFYVGGNLGMAIYDIQKWNYLDLNKYQRGFTFLMGFTVGYQFQYKENLNIDMFLGVANSQGFYHGYTFEGERYDNAKPWNRSGEWIPYKIGLMISYKLK